MHQIPSSSLPWHQSDNCKLPLLRLFAENMIKANNNTCKPDLKAQLKGYLNQLLAYGYLGALELYRRVLCLTSYLCLVMQGQGVLITDVLDGLKVCMQELNHLATSKEPVFPFSIIIIIFNTYIIFYKNTQNIINNNIINN